MISKNNVYDCGVYLIPRNYSNVTPVKKISIKLDYNVKKSIVDLICEGLRNKLIINVKEYKLIKACYTSSDCLAFIPVYPTEEGLININNPFMICDWDTYGLEE